MDLAHQTGEEKQEGNTEREKVQEGPEQRFVAGQRMISLTAEAERSGEWQEIPGKAGGRQRSRPNTTLRGLNFLLQVLDRE